MKFSRLQSVLCIIVIIFQVLILSTIESLQIMATVDIFRFRSQKNITHLIAPNFGLGFAIG